MLIGCGTLKATGQGRALEIMFNLRAEYRNTNTMVKV